MEMIEHVRRLVDMYSHGHQFFKVKFKRRNNKVEDGKIVARAGEETTIICRLHVTKHVKGVVPPEITKAKDFEKELITVWSPDRKGYRKIPLDAITFMQPCYENGDPQYEKGLEATASILSIVGAQL